MSDIESRLQAQLGAEWPAVIACDDVSAPALRHWREVFGFAPEWEPTSPVPVSMLGVWLAPGPSGSRPPGSATQDATAVLALLAEAGWPDVVGLGTEVDVTEPPLVGDRLSYTSTMERLSEPKSTALGPGRVVTFCFNVRNQHGRDIGALRFTHLVYRAQRHPNVGGTR